MEVAGQLFIERGYDAVSMQDIASAAERTKGALYGHFRSKGQLLVEVIRWKVAERESSEEFAEALQNADTAIELLFDEGSRPIRLLELDANAAARHDPAIAAGLAEFHREREAALEAALAERAHDPAVSANVILALAVGLSARDALGLPPPPAARLLEAMGGLLAGPQDRGGA